MVRLREVGLCTVERPKADTIEFGALFCAGCVRREDVVRVCSELSRQDKVERESDNRMERDLLPNRMYR